MGALFEHLPAIIQAAAQSYLGLFALLAIALALLAYFFFAKSLVRIRLTVFVLLLVAVVVFGVAMFRSSGAVAGTASATAAAALSKEATALIKGAAADSSGLVVYEKFGERVDLNANGVSFITAKTDHEVVATWDAALDELVKAGLLVNRGEQGEIYEITRAGYDRAKALGQ